MKQQYTFEYLAHEDEAQQTGVRFTVLDERTVAVQTLFLFPEYQGAPVKMPTVKARQLYSRLLHDADYRLIRSQSASMSCSRCGRSCSSNVCKSCNRQGQ